MEQATVNICLKQNGDLDIKFPQIRSFSVRIENESDKEIRIDIGSEKISFKDKPKPPADRLLKEDEQPDKPPKHLKCSNCQWRGEENELKKEGIYHPSRYPRDVCPICGNPCLIEFQITEVDRWYEKIREHLKAVEDSHATVYDFYSVMKEYFKK